MMEDWTEIRNWRRATRAKLLSQRLTVSRDEKARVRSFVHDLIREQFPEIRDARISFYWPFKGEIELRNLVGGFLASGAEAALPVVTEKNRPLEFWAWQPDMKLDRGIWNIPIPAERNCVTPTALLVPLLGFDASGYRLGYGGGYYDRTLAVMNPKPLTIGVGYAFGRLETIYPQPHDVPLDAIVTEAGCTQFRHHGEPLAGASRAMTPSMSDQDEPQSDSVDAQAQARKVFGAVADDDASEYASPPCFMHKLDPAYLGYMNAPEMVALLNMLLEAERAGARGVAEIAGQSAGATERTILRDVAQDEARFCAMLTRHIDRLGGTPSPETGSFYEKLMAQEDPGKRVELLNRGQGWVVRKLRDALPQIGDWALHSDLKNMLDVHERNIRRCTDLA